jgi:hypothetical protein
MTITDEITIIANRLANKGKKPSVALVKTKLSKPAPLPTIISVLRNWTHDPKLVELSIEAEDNSAKENSLSTVTPEVKEAIEKALQPIKAELTELRALVVKLSEQQV